MRLQNMHKGAHNCNAHWLQSESQAVGGSVVNALIAGIWYGCGDAELNSIVKTALMQHGIGPKACYYDASNNANHSVLC